MGITLKKIYILIENFGQLKVCFLIFFAKLVFFYHTKQVSG